MNDKIYFGYLLKNGYIRENGEPLKCWYCGSEDLEERGTNMIDPMLVEKDVFCKNKKCGKLLNSWAYGAWEWTGKAKEDIIEVNINDYVDVVCSDEIPSIGIGQPKIVSDILDRLISHDISKNEATKLLEYNRQSPSNQNVRRAIMHALDAIYFNDKSDYLSALHSVVCELHGVDELDDEKVKELRDFYKEK